jgi:Protein of unknown function DUF262/Restriction Enzyme Adenine Methylase Associated/Protein of unknown function (DUF1524)
MADSAIEGVGYTIQSLFTGRRFSLDYYQREYSWSRDSVQLLLSDLQRRFLANWRATDDREATARYEPYFLGPFVYHEEGGITYLVDGQQRITTLHLLLIYLRRLLADQELDGDAAYLSPLIYTRQRGRDSFTIDIPERHDLLYAILHERPYELPASHSPSLRTLYERNRDIDELYPEELRGDALPHFCDWLLERVCLVGIKALSRDNAWEIFESMNDRGVRLGPVDLLKSYLLSRVDPIDRNRLNNGWRSMIAQLRGIDANADSHFIKTVLSAEYAEDRQEIIALRSGLTPVHEWLRQNEDRTGLSSNPDFTRLTDRLLKLGEYYQMLVVASGKLDPDARFHALFYNQYNNLGVQLPMIFAAIAPGDQRNDVISKAEIIARFIDFGYVLGLVNNDSALSGIEAGLADLIPEVRRHRSLSSLKSLLDGEAAKLTYSFSGIDKFGLHQNVRQVRYLLARLTAFVETQCGRRDRIDEYLDGNQPFEIEHVLGNNPSYRSGQKRIPNFEILRNRIGGLVLLPKSLNASIGNMVYEEKVTYYRQENFLAASLHQETYGTRGNPGFKKFLKQKKFSHVLRPYDKFGASAVDTREQFYRQLCELIWSPIEFGIPGTLASEPARVPTRRPRTQYGVELTDLIDVGVLEGNTSIVGRSKKEQYTATILADGRVRVETGETFSSLSGAGQFVRGAKSCAGWSFWNLRRDGDLIPLEIIRARALEDGLVEPRR